jgi:hypothetical protein
MVITKTAQLKNDVPMQPDSRMVMVMRVGTDVNKFVKAFPERFMTQAK